MIRTITFLWHCLQKTFYRPYLTIHFLFFHRGHPDVEINIALRHCTVLFVLFCYSITVHQADYDYYLW